MGNPLFASHQAASQLNRAKLLDFVKNNFTSDRVAIVGTGVAAEDLKAVVQESLSKLVGTLPSSTTASTPTTTTSKTKYFGGESRIDAGPNTESHYVVAYPAPASTSADAATATVLRSLLDGTPHVKWGSSSASLLAGSPVPISTFNTAYSDAGLFGFYLQSDSATADEMTASINKAVAALKSVSSSVSETHLARAKKAAIVDYESALDGGRNQRLVILGTQVLSSGCFSKPADFATAVGKVTAADVAKVWVGCGWIDGWVDG